jgi:gluconolactonase
MERSTFNTSLSASLLRAWAMEFNREHRDASMHASMWRLRFAVAVIFGALVFLAGRALAETNADAPAGEPKAVIDLATREGVDLVKGQWRYSDTKIIQIDFKAAGPDKQPTGKPINTYDFTPHAGGADFDDSKWEKIDPTTLDARRSTGRLCFNWYRINITIPERVNEVDLAGATAVFETSIDDYAEIWVDAEIARALGQSGGSVVKGWNAPNRLIINRSVQPGQKIQLAIFGINEVNVEVIRKDPALDAIVPPNPKVFKLAEGFKFTEGPVWDPKGGYLLFSDPNNNTIYKYSPEGNGQLAVFREKSGYEGPDIAEYGQPGSNGLTFDREGRLTINQHGNRRVVRLESDGQLTVLADKFEGKRLNSPNDLVYRSDGTLYFTDPPFGLPKFFNDSRKELPFSGVFAVKDGNVKLVTQDFTGPNGIAFSPDEKYLYVGDWDEKKKVVMRYEVQADGSLKNGKLFFDMTSAPGEDALDGMKVDKAGNLYVSGPGGLWILSPQGKHLGTIIPPKHPHNFAWGDADGKTLYLCARSGLYHMKLNIEGIRP